MFGPKTAEARSSYGLVVEFGHYDPILALVIGAVGGTQFNERLRSLEKIFIETSGASPKTEVDLNVFAPFRYTQLGELYIDENNINWGAKYILSRD